ncbi:GNAT family N-acetyltransferase [Goodfellowiella coeruleoviolacea]|uniref:Ribosomal-protein-alanine N-acetyltransferase n=1 Tax=Goodfellowiella coeruleoviolacea TaxID=334858 RepID=A0AAE3GCZ4_9PSEU|nr:GNAT family N-acetyltransferase [Goodfellowiella coeruleoviolacea]MCP2165135.1 ribosomal-protein-alanine N-acetyltransferase [Goodfellowiella coeruleoviolacea]
MTPPLRTRRLTLTPYERADEEDFVALLGDENVSRWMGDGPMPEAAIRALFDRVFTKVYPRNLFDVWAVRDRRDGRYLGHAEIKHTEVVAGHEIIYALAAHAWRQGLGTELAEAVTDYGFAVLGLTEVHATVAAPNTASLALLARIGYRHVRDIVEDDGELVRVLTRRRQDHGRVPLSPADAPTRS